MIWSLRSRLCHYYMLSGIYDIELNTSLLSSTKTYSQSLCPQINYYPHKKIFPQYPRPISIHHRLQNPISAPNSHKYPNQDPHSVQS